ncbi:uncharacterized protein DEA37_0008812 [Paragonimus westermani]|uniref:Uncharacterized protein n=1 Tax=Paragonimus westermani TaxID=34504 RepID=A0A5J4NB13_9TREM|nr:uncharacterized protein DEA37_0008812 [Paragonimus westermani]
MFAAVSVPSILVYHECHHHCPGHTCMTLGENSSVCTVGGPGSCCCCCLACGRAHAVGTECEGAQSAVPADLKPSLRSRLIHQRLDSLYRSMPKLHRCASEPSMNAMRFERTDTCELTAYLNVSPKTPLNSVLSDNLFFFSGRTRDAPDSQTPVVDRSSDSTCLLEEEEDHKPGTHHTVLTEP